MNKEILKKVLQLDSLTGFLSWYERTEIHRNTIQSPKIFAAYDWIERNNWETPLRNYEQDRLLYFYDPDSDKWLQVEYYLKLHPEYKQELTKLKLLK